MYNKNESILFVRYADAWDGRCSSLRNSQAESASNPRPAHNNPTLPKEALLKPFQIIIKHQRALFVRKPHRVLLGTERHPRALHVMGQFGPTHERVLPAPSIVSQSMRQPVLRLPPLCMVFAVGS